MKNLLFLFVLTTFVVLVSCSKAGKNEIKPALKYQSGRADVTDRSIEPPDSYRVYRDFGGKLYGCFGQGGNCLPEVVVTPDLVSIMNELFVRLKMAPSLEKQNIFLQNEQLLKKYVPDALINAVISGELEVRVRDADMNPQRFLLFFENNSLAAAIPFAK